MKVTIIHSKEAKTIEVAECLSALLERAGVQRDDHEPELIISAGRDDTLLSALHRCSYCLNGVRFLDVHTGHLGFCADWRDYELEEPVDSLRTNRERSISYPPPNVRISYLGGTPDQCLLALNESAIKRTGHMMVADVYIKDELFESLRGDGLTVSTPIDSTTHNKGAGDAMIHPSINAFQLAETASLNNRAFRTLGSPVVIAHDEWLEIKLEDTEDYLAAVDQLSVARANIRSICYRIAEERIHFTSCRHVHFWHRVKGASINED